jgi:DNA-binding transcriptional LysR family regulator
MKVFHAVAVKGTLTKAALELGMTLSSVSKAVQQLERNLQTKLLYRTTRSQSLTDSGHIYLRSAKHILSELKVLEEGILLTGNEPSGLLRIAAPTALGQSLIAPKIYLFMQKHPQITIDLILDNRIIDITEEGFDLAIRTPNVSKMSSLYSIKLGSHTRKLVASPEYLSKVSLPDTPTQLLQMKLLNYPGTKSFFYWSFINLEREITIEPKAVFNSNNYLTLYEAALNNMGVANLYQYMVDDDIRDGKLIELLPEWQQRSRDLYAIYHQRRDSSPKLDAFLNFMLNQFN